MFPEESHTQQLQLLEKVLKRERFLFVIIGQNHRDVFTHIKTWLEERFSHQKISTIEIYGNDYRSFMDKIKNQDDAWILIPDFERLFEKGYEAFCTALNQRRDFFARNNKVLICFLFEENLKFVPEKIPDLWSLRTIELLFKHNISAIDPTVWDESIPESSTLGGFSYRKKQFEIKNLQNQLKQIDPQNNGIKKLLYDQLITLLFDISDYIKAKTYLLESLKLNKQTDDMLGEIKDLNRLARIFFIWGERIMSLEYLYKALQVAQNIADSTEQSKILNNIGQLYAGWGELNEANKYFELSLNLSEESGYRGRNIVALSNMAHIYYIKGEYPMALQIWEQVLTYAEKNNDHQLIGNILNNISMVHSTIGEYEKAMFSLKKALKIREKTGDIEGESITLNNLGTIFLKIGKTEKALLCFEKNRALKEKIGDKSGIAASLNNLAAIYANQGDKEKSLSYHQEALTIRRKLGDKAAIINSLHNIGVMAAENNDSKHQFQAFAEAWKLAGEIEDVKAIFNVGYAYGWSLCKSGKIADGIQVLRTAYNAGSKADLPGTEEVAELIKMYEQELISEKK